MLLDFFLLLKEIGLMGIFVKILIMFRFEMLVRLQGYLLLTLFPMALPSFFSLGRSLGSPIGKMLNIRRKCTNINTL